MSNWRKPNWKTLPKAISVTLSNLLHLVFCCLYLGLPSLTYNFDVREIKEPKLFLVLFCFLFSRDLSCITSTKKLKMQWSNTTKRNGTNDLFSSVQLLILVVLVEEKLRSCIYLYLINFVSHRLHSILVPYEVYYKS